jgi:hypothetical protein
LPLLVTHVLLDTIAERANFSPVGGRTATDAIFAASFASSLRLGWPAARPLAEPLAGQR